MRQAYSSMGSVETEMGLEGQTKRPVRIFISAGEASGDFIGAQLIQALKALYPAVEFLGVGGPQMCAQGFSSLFPMEELSLMGLVEVLPHVIHLKKRMNQLMQSISALKPDVVITIDSPGFHFPFAKRVHQLRQKGIHIPLVHYVAPTVWAWKEKRAEKMAKFYDHVLTLFSFEPPYFTKHGLKATFVGHPLMDRELSAFQGDAFRAHHHIGVHEKVLCVLPGSRWGEVSRLLPIFEKTITLLSHRVHDLHVVIPTLETLQSLVMETVKNWDVPVTVVTGQEEKYSAFQASHAAIAASGTVTLELALARVPMLVTYRVNRLTAWLLRRLIKVPYVCLVNILLKRRAIPEILQNDCKPTRLAEVTAYLLEDPATRLKQIQDMKEIPQFLQTDKKAPSEVAAAIILDIVQESFKGKPTP